MVTLSDVLFFTSGLKQLPPMRLGWDLSHGFLHDPDKGNNLFPYPKANTCGPVLQLPIVHKSIYVTLFGKTGLNKNSVVMHLECVDNAF